MVILPTQTGRASAAVGSSSRAASLSRRFGLQYMIHASSVEPAVRGVIAAIHEGHRPSSVAAATLRVTPAIHNHLNYP
jgi:hypothetical protein